MQAQVGASFNEVTAVADALPDDCHARGISSRVQQAQGRGGISRNRAGDPFLPVIHAVAIRIGVVGRAIGGQAVLLEPGDEGGELWRAEFISADVHRAANNTWVAVEVSLR